MCLIKAGSSILTIWVVWAGLRVLERIAMLKRVLSIFTGSISGMEDSGSSRASKEKREAIETAPHDSAEISIRTPQEKSISKDSDSLSPEEKGYRDSTASSFGADKKAVTFTGEISPAASSGEKIMGTKVKEVRSPKVLSDISNLETDPSSLRLAPICSQVDTSKSVPITNEILTKGEPFAEVDPQFVKSVCGVPLTRSGLSSLYANCVPGARVAIPLVKMINDHTLDYAVSWMDNNGKEVSHLDRRLVKNPDGSLELHSFNVWVEQSYRGRGTSARVLLNEMEFLKHLSSHDETRLTLRAGQAATGWKKTEKLGTYTWANFGFDFARKYQYETAFDTLNYPPPEKTAESQSGTDLDRMRKSFKKWVREQVDNDRIPGELFSGLYQLCEHWKHPWEISNLRIPGITLQSNIGGQDLSCDIGKAYLTSESAPFWDGAIYVNHRDSKGLELGQKYCEKSLERARVECEKDNEHLKKALESKDEHDMLQALNKIGAQGGAEWRTFLNAHSGKLSTVLKKAMEMTSRKIKGDALEKGLCETIMSREEPVAARIQAYLRLRCVAGCDRLDIFNKLLSEPRNDLRLEALSSLYWTEWIRNPGIVADAAAALLPGVQPDATDETVCCLRKWIYSILAFGDGDRYARTLYEAAKVETRADILTHIREVLRNAAGNEARRYCALLDSQNGPAEVTR